METNGDEPVVSETLGQTIYFGLTKREHMAIEITKAFISNSSITEHARICDLFYKDTVRCALNITDELIKQLNYGKD